MSHSTKPSSLRITEVGPRDGLQNQSGLVSTAAKIAFVDALVKAGVAEVEVSSFVSPKWVPQLADAAEVFTGVARTPDVVLSALIPNLRGMERALEAGVEKVSVFAAATDAFSLKNTNAPTSVVIDRFEPVLALAKSQGLPVRGYISCVVQCPYAGRVDVLDVVEIVKRLLDLGVDEIDFGETMGVAVPCDIARLYDATSGVVEPAATTLHMHDTRGTGLACVLAAYELGVRSFDTSSGGLGGCPYAPGAAGNIATEDVVFCFEQMAISTGVDLDQLIRAGMIIENALGRPLPGRAYRARKSQGHF